MSVYTVSAAASETLESSSGTPVSVPDQFVFTGGAWKPATGCHFRRILLQPGVVLSAEVGSYLASVVPSLITVT